MPETIVQNNALTQRLAHVSTFELPEFPYSPGPWGGLQFRGFSEASAADVFHTFAQRVIDSIGSRYLPVYRLADGEFAFMVGPQESGSEHLPRLLRDALNLAKVQWRRVRGVHRRTCWDESYPRSALQEARTRMRESLLRVSGTGYLAPYFFLRPDGWNSAFYRPVCGWLDRHGIQLNANNYVPFYGVYALLAGPRRKELLEGRHVLIATHVTAERSAAIRRGLESEGVASVSFLPVSATSTLLDEVDLSAVERRVDLAIVAAGIGSVNIMDQLRPLSVPCIDAGIAVECWIDAERRWDRPFLIAADRASASEIAARRKF